MSLLGQAKAKYEIFMNFKGQFPVAGESHLKVDEANFSVTQEDVRKHLTNETVKKANSPIQLTTKGDTTAKITKINSIPSFGDSSMNGSLANLNKCGSTNDRSDAFEPTLITEAQRVSSPKKVGGRLERQTQTELAGSEDWQHRAVKICMKIYTNSKEAIITPTVTVNVVRRTRTVKEDLFSKQNMFALNKRLEECRRMKESIAKELGLAKIVNDFKEGSKRKKCDIVIANRDQAKNYLDHRIKQISALSFVNHDKIEAKQIRAKIKLQENKSEKLHKIHENNRRKEELRLDRLRSEQRKKTMIVLGHYRSLLNFYGVLAAVKIFLKKKRMDALRARVFLKKVIFIQRSIKSFFSKLPQTRLERRLVDGGRTLQGLGLLMASLARRRAVNTLGVTMSRVLDAWIVKNKFLTYILYSKTIVTHS